MIYQFCWVFIVTIFSFYSDLLFSAYFYCIFNSSCHIDVGREVRILGGINYENFCHVPTKF